MNLQRAMRERGNHRRGRAQHIEHDASRPRQIARVKARDFGGIQGDVDFHGMVMSQWM